MIQHSKETASLFHKLEKRRQPATVELVPLQQSLQVDSGGVTKCQVRVSNHGVREYTFEVRLEGIEPSWQSWQRLPTGIKVGAGKSVELALMIMPPRNSSSRAGNYPLTFVVSAVEQPKWQQILRTTLIIKPYEAFSVALNQGQPSGRWLIPLCNESNQPLSLRLTAEALDQKAKSHFVFQQGKYTEWQQAPLSIHLPAGAKTEIGMIVTLFGPPKHDSILRMLWPTTHKFQLSVTSNHHSTAQKRLEKSVQGEIKLPSLIKTPLQGMIVVNVFFCLLLLFVGVGARQYMMRQEVANPPPLASLLSGDAVEWEPSLLPALNEMPVFVPPDSDSLPPRKVPTITLASDILIETEQLLLGVATLPADTNAAPTSIFSTLTPTPQPSPTSTPLPTAEALPTQSPFRQPIPTAMPTQVPTQPAQAVATAQVVAIAPYNYASESVMTYEVLFQQMGAYYGLDWRLLASIAYRESRLNPSAIGSSGEYGLMQILPSTWNIIAPRLGVSNPFDPYSNVLAGTAYLAYLRNYVYSLGHSEEYWILVAYNWGPNNVADLLRNGGGWGDLPYIRQKYVYDIFDELNQPASNLWLYQLRQPVPRQ